MNRTDLADPTAGILASLESHQPLAVFERGGMGGTASFELETEPLGGKLEFNGDKMLGHWWVETLRLRGRLRGGDGSTTPLEAIGAVTRGEDDAAAGTLRRNIVICLEDGGLLAIFAARRSRDDEHGSESMVGALADPSGAVTEFEEIRLSTEYGPDARQRRATLELWPAGPSGKAGRDGPIRGAGVAVAAAELALAGAESTLAFFEWSIAGRPAIGRYEIIYSQ